MAPLPACQASRWLAATAPSGPPASTLPLPTTTEPEQLLLTWGATRDPGHGVLERAGHGGPAATLAWSTRPITDANPGRLIKLPDPSPLDVTRRYDEAAAVSFTDDLNWQTTYFYHVQLSGPATRYYYKISDGAATCATPTWTSTTPRGCGGTSATTSAAARPAAWMPALGNHEVEFGTGTRSGHPGGAPGGTGAQGAAGNYWNGPYGFGHYLSRFLLPDNGVVNWDGNRLRGNFYTFQVGTVKFISLDADDVIYQDGAANYVIGTPNTAPEKTTAGAQIPNGTTAYTRFYTGDLKPDAKDNSLIPDYGSGQPNLQTIWLEKTLTEARRDRSVDMIVVFMHQCAMSTSVPGNGSDLGIRQAWLPLFDKYEVDLVLSGHEHDYERTYPVRGYDAGDLGTVVAPNPGQTTRSPRSATRQARRTTAPPRCRRRRRRSSSSAGR